MRLLLGFVFLEALVFIAVGAWIGYGWAILLVLGLMLVGGLAGSASLRATMLRARTGKATPGKVAGDSGLIMAGWAMSMIPGIVSSVVGLTLLFGPTRSIIRRSVATKLTRDIENFGVSMYEHSPMAKRHDHYGSFDGSTAAAHPSHPSHGAQDTATGSTRDAQSSDDMVIDADEIERWTRDLNPEDFQDPKKDRKKDEDK